MEITLNGEREQDVSKNRVNRKSFFDAFFQITKMARAMDAVVLGK